MAELFLAEIRVMSFQFAPKGWALTNGQLLAINQNQALFALLGTTFGGDGRVNFALPDVRGRTPIQMGEVHQLGERGGEQAHTLINLTKNRVPSLTFHVFRPVFTLSHCSMLMAAKNLIKC
nr:tail fiber protein [Dyadobacter sp. CY356]